MNVMADVRLAWLNLWEHRRRTLVLGLALASVSGSYSVLAALLEGFRQSTVDTAAALATGHLSLTGYQRLPSGQSTMVLPGAAQLTQLVRDKLPEAERIVERGRGWGRIVSDEGVALTAGVTGVDLASEPQLRQVLSGTRGKLDDLTQPGTILLFESQAETLGVSVGDMVTVAAVLSGGATNTIDCRVVAIAPELGALSKLSTFIANASWRTLYQLAPNTVATLQVTLRPPYVDDVAGLAARLRQALTGANYQVMEADAQPSFAKLESAGHEDWTGLRVDVATWSDELPTVLWSLQTLHGLVVLLLVLLSAIALAGVANALFIAVRERTREIGTLRALGASRLTIARLFMLEAALLGALAGGVGAICGALLALLLDAAGLSVTGLLRNVLVSSSLRFVVQPGLIAGEVLVISFTTSLAACWPALRAALRPPSTAMTHYT